MTVWSSPSGCARDDYASPTTFIVVLINTEVVVRQTLETRPGSRIKAGAYSDYVAAGRTAGKERQAHIDIGVVATDHRWASEW